MTGSQLSLLDYAPAPEELAPPAQTFSVGDRACIISVGHPLPELLIGRCGTVTGIITPNIVQVETIGVIWTLETTNLERVGGFRHPIAQSASKTRFGIGDRIVTNWEDEPPADLAALGIARGTEGTVEDIRVAQANKTRRVQYKIHFDQRGWIWVLEKYLKSATDQNKLSDGLQRWHEAGLRYFDRVEATFSHHPQFASLARQAARECDRLRQILGLKPDWEDF